MPQGIITSDPKIMMSKPVVAGTRITVEFIPEKLAACESIDQILSAHPRLTLEKSAQPSLFDAGSARSDVVCPVEKIVG
jgi:hypothetical protein